MVVYEGFPLLKGLQIPVKADSHERVADVALASILTNEFFG